MFFFKIYDVYDLAVTKFVFKLKHTFSYSLFTKVRELIF